jgi:drug/metabolite transporter (DMT)-like permease
MNYLGNLGVLGSEIVLSLYPILIKTVKTNFNTQLISRFGVFTLASLLFASKTQFSSLLNLPRLLGYGAISLFHVIASYTAFANLSTGTAMALFYTYPIMNVIAGVLFLNESLSFTSILFLALGFLGTYLLAQEIPNEEVKGENPNKIPKNYAILAGLLAAFSETLMFLIVRQTKSSNPIDSMIQLYPGALLLLIVYLTFTNQIKDISTDFESNNKLVWFNLIIGFIGYSVRFFSISNVSTLVFSLLSFVGVLSSYFFGKVFVKESVSSMSFLGAALIAGSASGISFLQ